MNFMKTSEKIIKYVTANKQASAREITDNLEISERAVFKQLSNLVAEGKLAKIGWPPKVFYVLKEAIVKAEKYTVDPKIKKIIEDRFMIITSAGERKAGWEGFAYWCGKNNQPVEKTAAEYVKTLQKYDAFRKNNLLDGMGKMKNTFKQVFLDAVFYLDFYAIERFGKTKMGQLLLYAKQSQNRKLMKELIGDIRPEINYLVKKYQIDGIGFVPPTVKREVQLMKVLEKELHPSLRKLKITKIKTEVIVPQKTLNKLNDRVENARRTFVVEDEGKHKNILLIDDAVGSGATLNEIAAQIKSKKIAKKIIGLSITGSYKGFDVISEV